MHSVTHVMANTAKRPIDGRSQRLFRAVEIEYFSFLDDVIGWR
jgi:hypothetical protein